MLLNVKLARSLPEVIGIGEEDGLATAGLNNSLKGSTLLSDTGDGVTVGITGVGPAGLEVVGLLARADTAEDLKLRLDELSGLGGSNLGIEEGMKVGTDDVNSTAESGAILLPDVQGLGGGNFSAVAGLLEGGLGRRDETGEIAGRDVAVLDGLVTDNDEANQFPLGPGSNGANLLLCLGDTAAGDKDTQDQLQAVLLGSLTDKLKTTAVGGVDTDGVEALLLGDGNISQNVGLGLAATLAGVRGVGYSKLAATDGTTSAGRSGCTGRGSRSARRGGGAAGFHGGGGWSRSRSRSGRCGSSRSRCRGAGETGAEGADIGV